MSNELSLTENDISILLEAIDSWASAPIMSGMLRAIIASSFTKTEEDKDKLIETQIKKMDEGAKTRKEQSIMLKAKILKLKDKIVVNEIIGG